MQDIANNCNAIECLPIDLFIVRGTKISKIPFR